MYTPSKKLLDQVENNFHYHSPHGDQAVRYTQLREAFRGLALHMLNLCPESRELSVALTHLEDASMWANAAIARNEPMGT